VPASPAMTDNAAVTDPTHALDLHLDLASDEEADELEQALLKARATELTEVRRRNVRLTAGYGDATARAVMDDEGRRAQVRYEVLGKLLTALRDGSR